MKTGIVGWRGMVGTMLVKRMVAENDFSLIDAYFFSTSQSGEPLPKHIKPLTKNQDVLLDANSYTELAKMEIILTCQGGDYTKKVHDKLRELGWSGYWIDASSALRTREDSIIVLDPVNRDIIENGLKSGIKIFSGSNCSTSTLLMGIVGLIKEDLVRSISLMTYQAASGAGARHVVELIEQMQSLGKKYESSKKDKNLDAVDLQLQLNEKLKTDHPIKHFGYPLAGSLLPWIDSEVEGGQSREEKKTMEETNKILNLNPPIPVDGICVRVPVLQCHSEAVTITLKKDISAKQAEEIIAAGNDYVRVIPNRKEPSLQFLTPHAVMGSLNIHVGRIRKMKTDPLHLSAFIVGDQLLWGAAEPLRRMLRIIVERSDKLSFDNKKSIILEK